MFSGLKSFSGSNLNARYSVSVCANYIIVSCNKKKKKLSGVYLHSLLLVAKDTLHYQEVSEKRCKEK